MIPEDALTTVQEILDADSRVVVAYLFGSLATGRTGPRSDVDLAVLLAGDEAARRRAHGELMDALVRALRTESIDLIDLDEAPDPVRYSVIRDGRRLLSRDEKLRQRFETGTVMRYLDFEPLRQAAFRTARDVITGAR